MFKRISIVLILALFLSGAVFVSLTGAEKGDVETLEFEVIATGLDNPRGLVFGPDGLYVAEAGLGGDGICAPNPEGGERCFGLSGAVTLINGAGHTTVVSNMVSLAPQTPTVGIAATGPHDVTFNSAGQLYVVTGLGADPNARLLTGTGSLGAMGIDFGQLVEANTTTGNWTSTVDIAAYEVSDNPDGSVVDSNPYSLLAVDDGFVAVDAGGNTLLHIDNTGTVTTLAVFPSRQVANPFGPGTMPMQSVPTSVALAPDGGYFVGELTGFPFPVGGANVYHIPAQGTTMLTASTTYTGFTNIIDLTVDPAGNLYVLEHDSSGLFGNDVPFGAIIRVAPDGSRETIVSAEDQMLVKPGGIAFGPDGALYVSNNSIFPGNMPNTPGQVLKITLDDGMSTIYLPVVLKQ